MYEQIVDLICRKNNIDRNNISLKSSIKNDIGLNSLQIIELIGEIEDLYDIEIPDRKLRELQTVNQVVDFLEEQTQ
jgi:acyl carrier protein